MRLERFRLKLWPCYFSAWYFVLAITYISQDQQQEEYMYIQCSGDILVFFVFLWNTEYRVKLALEKIHKNNETYVINLFLINISRKKTEHKNKQHMKGTKYILWRSCANNRKKSLWTWVIEMFSWIWNKKANWRLKRPNDTSRHGDEENYRRKISIYSLLNTDTFQNV